MSKKKRDIDVWILALFLLSLSALAYYRFDHYYSKFLKDTKMQRQRY